MMKIKDLKKRFNRWRSFNSPTTATLDVWDDFKTEFKISAPVRYFFSNVFPKWFNRPRWIGNVIQWFRYRIIRYHVIDTELEPGYYEIETLMLYAAFKLLKDFVEVEKGWMNHCMSLGASKLKWYVRCIPFYTRFFFRDRAGGLEYLLWESDLDQQTPERDRTEAQLCVGQATAARELIVLYLWWVDERPVRKDPEYPQELVEFDKVRDGAFSWLSNRFTKAHPTEYAIYKKHCIALTDVEEAWKMEDTEMFIRLIKIRDSMWT